MPEKAWPVLARAGAASGGAWSGACVWQELFGIYHKYISNGGAAMTHAGEKPPTAKLFMHGRS